MHFPSHSQNDILNNFYKQHVTYTEVIALRPITKTEIFGGISGGKLAKIKVLQSYKCNMLENKIQYSL